MGARLIEAVPNFSEGADAALVDALAHVVSRTPGAYLLDRTSDSDHNRTVLTLAGDPNSVQEAAIAAVGRAAELIDLRTHRGVHPRMGACDVLPFIPVEGVTLAECVEIAHAAGQKIWRRFRIPVFFYEAAALSTERRLLENVRRGGFEAPNASPDIGGPCLHPSAGATIVGARKFLIAYNINLDSPNLDAAKAIARKIRASSGGLPFVKAMGLFLESRKQAQVSMNLTDFEQTSIDDVYRAVEAECALHAMHIASSELIGLIPHRALPTIDVRWENFNEGAIFENRLTAALHSK